VNKMQEGEIIFVLNSIKREFEIEDNIQTYNRGYSYSLPLFNIDIDKSYALFNIDIEKQVIVHENIMITTILYNRKVPILSINGMKLQLQLYKIVEIIKQLTNEENILYLRHKIRFFDNNKKLFDEFRGLLFGYVDLDKEPLRLIKNPILFNWEDFVLTYLDDVEKTLMDSNIKLKMTGAEFEEDKGDMLGTLEYYSNLSVKKFDKILKEKYSGFLVESEESELNKPTIRIRIFNNFKGI